MSCAVKGLKVVGTPYFFSRYCHRIQTTQGTSGGGPSTRPGRSGEPWKSSLNGAP